MINPPLNRHQSILIIDDVKFFTEHISRELKKEGYTNTVQCNDERNIRQILLEHSIEIIILDLNMPHISGKELLAMLNSDFPEIPVIIVTEMNNLKIAVNCMRLGAFDFMTKPIDTGLLAATVKRALTFRELNREVKNLKRQLPSYDELNNPTAFKPIITQSKTMFSMFKYMESIAPSLDPILITGETGVGKEMPPRIIHELSGRKGQFVVVNIAGIDDHVFSDTLFGHAKGAFTGAINSRKGFVEKAAHGTLFLDEIGDLDLQSQIKLLRLIDQNEYLPLGQDTVKKSNIRIIVATNRDLWQLCTEGSFRWDLLYRLRTHYIQIPPLRERLEDLPLLINHFIELSCNALKKEKPTVPDQIIPFLGTYSFPGNVRELRSMVSNAISQCHSNKLSLNDFKSFFSSKDIDNGMSIKNQSTTEDSHVQPVQITDNTNTPVLFQGDILPTLREVNEILVNEAMRRSDGVQTDAAKILGITRSALSKRLKKMGYMDK